MEYFYGDVLARPFNIKFEYVIGNPPYISYRNLEKEVRDFIKEYIPAKMESLIIAMLLSKMLFNIWIQMGRWCIWF